MAVKNFNPQFLDRWFGIVLGESGAGKTRLISTIPEDQKVLIVSAESGLLSIRDMLLTRKNVSCVTVDEWADVVDVVHGLKRPETRAKFDWVAFDSLTAISELCFKDADKIKTNNNYAPYAALGERITDLILTTRDMYDYTVLYTCLVKVDDTVRGQKNFFPNIRGNIVKDNLHSWFDEVFLLTVNTEGKEIKRAIQTGVYGDFLCKDRSGVLDAEEPADLTVITQKMKDATAAAKALAAGERAPEPVPADAPAREATTEAPEKPKRTPPKKKVEETEERIDNDN
jgi:hypothetical protein